jgi:hypothetical protein
MVSRLIKQPEVKQQSSQLTLDLDPAMRERYRSLRDCIATGVYQRGLSRVAIDLDLAPSNLSVQLSEDPARRFSVDHLETYIEKTGDTTPIYYLISKFLQDERDAEAEANAELLSALKAMAPKLRKAGLL